MNYTIRNLVIVAVLMMVGITLVTSFIRSERRELSRGKKEISVLVAAKDIPAGTSASELETGGFLESRDIMREDAPPQALGSIKSVKELVSNETIYEGEVVSMTAFDRTAGLKPTAQIKGNERLFSMPVNAANDVAGMVRPGDHVDLWASFGTQTDLGQIFQGKVIARDIEVIETPDSLQPKEVEKSTEAPDAEGDTKLYVFKATDEEAASILFAHSAADEFKVYMLLNPANGDSATTIDPIVGPLPPRMSAEQLPQLKGSAGTYQAGPANAVR